MYIPCLLARQATYRQEGPKRPVTRITTVSIPFRYTSQRKVKLQHGRRSEEGYFTTCLDLNMCTEDAPAAAAIESKYIARSCDILLDLKVTGYPRNTLPAATGSEMPALPLVASPFRSHGNNVTMSCAPTRILTHPRMDA